jgi:hypothetical protein
MKSGFTVILAVKRILTAIGLFSIIFLFDIRTVFIESSITPLTSLPIDSIAPVPVFETRYDMGSLLQNERFVSGVELGVQRGDYAAEVLKKWPGCREYVLVDLWERQDNYFDVSNVDNSIQNKLLDAAIQSTNPWKDIITICRNYTTSCALNYANNHFDWVYVDARHDRKGVTEDLSTWWPKVRSGGIMCGHDFVTQFEGPQQNNARWDINGDGTVDPTGGAVRGSVEDWARVHHRQIQIGYKESGWWTWCLRK